MEKITSFFYANEGVFRAIGAAVLVLLVFFAMGWLLGRFVLPFFEKRLKPEKHKAFSILINGFRRPLTALLRVLGLCFALLAFSSRMNQAELAGPVASFFAALSPLLYRTIRISFILAVAWGLVSSSEISSLLLRGARHRLDIKMGKSVTRFLTAIFNVVVVAITVVILISEFGYNINGLVAGLGLGGLTVALAAQDSAANLFGGLVLVLEKPFEIGDWISCGDVEGIVEDINLRSTKVRTIPGSLTIVPNSKLSGAAITNWSGGMEKRRASFTLFLAYSTPRSRIEQYTDALRAMLQQDEQVGPDSIIVQFSGFSASGLEVQVIFYTTLPGLAEHFAIRQRVNLAILRLAEEHQIEFAFPTTTVQLNNATGSEEKEASPQASVASRQNTPLP